MALLAFHMQNHHWGHWDSRLLNLFEFKMKFSFCKIQVHQQPPQPAESWHGVYDATKEGNDCLQYSLLAHELMGSEDCLYANIYTPEACNLFKSATELRFFWLFEVLNFTATGLNSNIETSYGDDSLGRTCLGIWFCKN